ncbi:alpha/beta hydrolase [Paenarthrobacter sp. NPDC092416]|uniref:alpha/beta hydrolase n=1 Tax=Paenarthrobacter sp. NPDC092416 TaxID=3364386 RepID=UPI0037F8F164
MMSRIHALVISSLSGFWAAIPDGQWVHEVRRTYKMDDMTYQFDSELEPVLAMLPDQSAPSQSVAEVREQLAQYVAGSSDIDISGVRVYAEMIPGPDGAPEVTLHIIAPSVRKSTGAIYYIHGGGFTVGFASMRDDINIPLARDLGVVIISVDYRLAPEHPFPAGLEDCYAGLQWVADHAEALGIDPANIAIQGDSAGGGLCAGLALLTRDRGGVTPVFQYLGVPEIDDRLTTLSMQRFTDTPMWTRRAAEESWDAYLGDGVRGTDGVSRYAAPARATELSGLPPTYISVMQYDPLRDENLAYAQKLLDAGVSVELHLYPGTFHGSSLATYAAITQRESRETFAVFAKALGVNTEN